MAKRSLENNGRIITTGGNSAPQPSQQMNIMAYYPEEDYFSGPASRFGITVTGHRKKPYWVSARTPQLTTNDVAKAYTAATIGLLPNPISAVNNLINGNIKGALTDAWLYNAEGGDNPDVNYGIVGFSVPEGSLFSSISKAAKATPEQWNAAYRAAYKRGDKVEGQRLWDLWFKQKAPNTKQTTPMFNASGESNFNEFNGGKTGLNWFSESEEYAANHGVPRAFYINEPDIYFGNVPAWVKGTSANERYIESLKKLGYTDEQIVQRVQEINEAASSAAPAAKSVGMGNNNELVTRNNNTIKLAEPFTLDDNGRLIDLTDRANFNINDIRYGLLPFLGLGAAAYGLNSEETSYKDGGSIHIKPSKRGTFTAAASKHGMGVQEFASNVLANKDAYSPAMVKKANFAKVFGGRKFK